MELICFQFLIVENFYCLIVFDGFIEKLCDVVYGVLNVVVDMLELFVGEVYYQVYQRCGDQQNQCQFLVLIQQEGEQIDYGEVFVQYYD